MFFDLNGDEYEYYNAYNRDQIDQVDIALSSPTPEKNVYSPKSKITLDLDIWENYENQYYATVNYISTDYRITNALDHSIADPRILFCDFVFNLVKGAYTQHAFRPDYKLFFILKENPYHIIDHPATECKQKIYVAPNKTHVNNAHIANSHTGLWNHKNRHYRSMLVDLLCQKYSNLGYIGDVFRNPSLFLYSQLDLTQNFDNLHSLENHEIKLNFDLVRTSFLKGYSPAHDLYYQNTFISIFGETIESGTTIAVTEKTYDPLIRGHFILPFSCAGFIEHLRNLDFIFPDFIDYDYDNQLNDAKRFDMYVKEVERLLNLDIDIWREHWNNNLDIIRHNQSIFFDRDYDRVDFSKIL